MKRQIYKITELILLPLLLLVTLLVVIFTRYFSSSKNIKPRLVWGDEPIINNKYWSQAMYEEGYKSEIYTDGFSSTISHRNDFGRILKEEYSFLPKNIARYCAFIESIIKYDVFFISFTGFFLGKTIAWPLESFFFKLSKKKVVVIPFGGDSYIYNRVRSSSLLHGLLMSVPAAAREQKIIAKRVDCWVKNGDFIIPATMGADGFGRWDVLVPSILYLDLGEWNASERVSSANGINDTVYITHTPNHRGFKGTEFIIDAVDKLKSEGLKIELTLIEGKQNNEVKSILQNKTDILIEQLIFTGHGLNGLEGMASSVATISNLEDESYILPFRRWSYFLECPLVSASPETITDKLRMLITRPELRNILGKAGRQYVEKYHGLDSARYLFSEIIKYLYGERDSLINMYHPLLGEYNKKKAFIKHPLVKNNIIDN